MSHTGHFEETDAVWRATADDRFRTTENRLTIVETNFKHFDKNVTELSLVMKELTIAMQSLKEQLAAQKHCPFPGKCIELGEMTSELKRIGTANALAVLQLEKRVERGYGAFWMITSIGGLVVFGITVWKFLSP